MIKNFIAAALAGLMLTGIWGSPAHAQDDKIKVTIGWQPTMNGARFFIADIEGLFEKEKLDVSLIKFTAGPPFFAAFHSASIDVGFMGMQPAVTAVAQGIPVKIIVLENDASGAEGLVARSDSGIKKLSDLRGKRVATKRGSSAHTALLTGLEKGGLTLSDINLIDLDVTALIPAFRKGDIDAAWYWEPWMGLLKRANGEVIVTDGQINLPVGIVWVAREAWLQENQEAMKRLLRILDTAADLIRKQPKELSAKIAKRLGLSAEHVYEVLTKQASWPTNAESFAESYVFSLSPNAIAANKGLAGILADNAEFQKKSGIITKVPDFTTAVDPSYMAAYLKNKK